MKRAKAKLEPADTNKPTEEVFGASLDVSRRDGRNDGERVRHGRYTLHEAASVLEKKAGERYALMLKKLKAAVFAGTLPIVEPRRHARALHEEFERASYVDEHYGHVFSNDLNTWL